MTMSNDMHQAHTSMDQGKTHQGDDHSRMEMAALPVQTQCILIVASFAILFGAGLITNLFVPIRFGFTN